MSKLSRIIIYLSCLIIISCGSVEEKKSEYLERASNYVDARDYKQARKAINFVLRIDPEDINARLLNAKIEVKRKKYDKALAIYSDILNSAPDDSRTKLELGQLHLLTGRAEKAQGLAESILQLDPQNLGALSLKVSAIEKLQGPRKAIAQAQAIVEQFPNEEASALLLARLFESENETASAIETLNRGLSKNPDSKEIHKALIALYEVEGESAQIEKLLTTLVNIHPEDFDSSLKLAELYVAQSEPQKAHDVLRSAIEKVPGDPRRKLHLVNFLMEQDGAEAAEKKLLAFTKKTPDAPALRFGLASIYAKAGKQDKAESLYRDLIQQDAQELTTLKAKRELAKLLFQENRLRESKQIIDEVLKDNPGDLGTLYTAAHIAISQQDYSTAVLRMHEYLRRNPDSLRATLLLSKAHQLNNQRSLAAETLVRAVQRQPKNPEVRLALVDYLQSQGKYQRGLNHIGIILRDQPNHMDALITKTNLQMESQDLVSARGNAEFTVAQHPTSVDPYLQLGRIDQLSKNYDQAIDSYQKAIALDPDNIDIYVELIRSYSLADRLEDAKKWLTSLKQGDDHQYNKFLWGQIAEHEYQFDDAVTKYKEVIASQADLIEPYDALASLYIETDRNDQAILVYKNGLKKNPDSQVLMLGLAKAYTQNGSMHKAIDQYEEILDKNSQNAIAANNLATLLSEQKGDQTSVNRALSVAKSLASSGNPVFMDTLGWIYFKLDRLDRAMPLLARAVSKAPDSALLNYHLGMGFLKQNRNVLASRHLEKALKLDPNFQYASAAKQALTNL